MPHQEIFFDFYGTTALVSTANPDIQRWLHFDFSHFIVPHVDAPAVKIEAAIGQVPWDLVPEVVESSRSPEYVCFDDGHIRYVNYLGRALVQFDYQTETAKMFSTEAEYLFEKLYLLLLSRTGELLDRRGIHRVHGLAVAVQNKASLFLMPSGGGKSTLGLSLLRYPDVQLISEDTPLLKLDGYLYPFPLRLGISKKQIPESVPEQYVREFHRERWGTKYLLHADFFKQQLQQSPVPLRFIFTGKWINSATPRIERMNRLSITLVLTRDCVFGLGLPQIIEFFLTNNPMDILQKSGIAFRRTFAAIRLAFKSTPYRIFLSKNLEANSQAVMTLLREP